MEAFWALPHNEVVQATAKVLVLYDRLVREILAKGTVNHIRRCDYDWKCSDLEVMGCHLRRAWHSFPSSVPGIEKLCGFLETFCTYVAASENQTITDEYWSPDLEKKRFLHLLKGDCKILPLQLSPNLIVETAEKNSSLRTLLMRKNLLVFSENLINAKREEKQSISLQRIDDRENIV